MIYDKIKNINLYKGLYPNLDIAIDYIKKGEYVHVHNMDALRGRGDL